MWTQKNGVCQRVVLISGSALIRGNMVMEINAQELQVKEFDASNGWLEKWKMSNTF